MSDLGNEALERVRARLNSPTIGAFEGVFTKVERAADGRTYWQATCSDDGVDLYGTRMSIDLFDDFVRNAQTKRMPDLTVSHYFGISRVGRATELFRQGRRLKAKGYFATDDADPFVAKLAEAAADAALAEKDNMARMRRIRTSIGFTPGAAEPEDLGIIAYTRGFLAEITMTTHPANSRVDFLAQEDDMPTQKRALDMQFMEEDAATIVGAELAAELSERYKKIAAIARAAGDAGADDPLLVLYRFNQEPVSKTRVLTTAPDRTKTDASPLDIAAMEARVRAWSGEPIDWTKYRQAAAVYEGAGDTPDAHAFLHHDVDDKGLFVSMAALVAASAATDLPKERNEEARAHLEEHFVRANRTAPWKREKTIMAHRIEDIMDLRLLTDVGVLTDTTAVDRAIGQLTEDVFARVITDYTGVSQVDSAAPDEASTLFTRTQGGEVKISLVRIGKKLQAAKVTELKNLLSTVQDAAALLEGVVTWAEGTDEPAGDAGEERAGDQRALSVLRSIRSGEGEYSLGPLASVIDAATMRHNRYMEIEADSSIMEVQEHQEMMDAVMSVMWTLRDIIAANLEPNDGDEDDLTLQDRQQNIESAVNEALAIVNSFLMTSFGNGRMATVADNSGERKNRMSTTKDIKPGAGGNGAINGTGGSTDGPDLTRFDEAVEKARQLQLGKNVTTQELETALGEIAAAASENLPAEALETDALVERVAGVEIGLANIEAVLEEIRDQRAAPSDSRDDHRFAPRRRGLRPASGPAAGSEPREPAKKRTGASIKELAQRTTARQFGQPYP